jgi:hypothetical protein
LGCFMEEKWLFAGFDGNYFFALGDFYLEADSF